jgi:hypothetical protein
MSWTIATLLIFAACFGAAFALSEWFATRPRSPAGDDSSAAG